MLKIVPVHYRRLVCVFEKANFAYQRTRGDHLVYTKPGIARPLVIPMYSEVPVFIIKNLLRAAHIDRDGYFRLLKLC